jgi:hypothetical protein
MKLCLITLLASITVVMSETNEKLSKVLGLGLDILNNIQQSPRHFKRIRGRHLQSYSNPFTMSRVQPPPLPPAQSFTPSPFFSTSNLFRQSNASVGVSAEATSTQIYQ